MKQNTIRLTLIITILLMAFVGCSQEKSMFALPNESKNFDHDFLTTFSNKYFVADPQLVEASYAPWEIDITNPANHEERLRLAALSDFPGKEFISVTKLSKEGLGYFGKTDGYLIQSMILQSTQVLPMKDWTISKVTIKVMDHSDQSIQYSCTVKNDQQRTQSPLAKSTNIFNSALLLVEWNADDNAGWIQALQSAYASPCTDLTTSPKLMYLENFYQSQCVILVEFKETDDIVWLGSIYAQNENETEHFYICSSYYDAQGKLCQGYSELPEEFTQEIQSLIAKNTK